MKLFQKLLLAPAALGLMAPVAASASELNIAGVSQYGSEEQVTSITQFSDVQPTDWAYQALSNLIERYGCVAGYPNGTYRGSRAMTRFEAAALLNACLDRITEVTDELKRLMKEFEKELAVLKGRVDGLEAKVAELEATQFSTTTKLKGEATFDIGAYTYGGSAKNGNTGPGLDGESLLDAMVFNYQVRLNFDTSFTGKDLLRTRLRAGNYANSAFDGGQYRSTKLDKSFESEAGPNVVDIDRLYYTFPVGNELKATLGARVRNTEMLAITPSAYKSYITDFLYGTYGTSGTYNKETGSGVGLVWKQKVKKGNPYLAAAVNYVAKNAQKGNPDEGGIMTDNSAGSFLAQLGGAGKGWALTGAYRYGQCGTNIRSGTQYTYDNSKTKCAELGSSAATNSFAINGYWQPSESGWVPSISAGWGITTFTDGYEVAINTKNAQSWMVGLQWDDVFVDGNSAGMGVGQSPFTTSTFDGSTPYDGNYAWEWWYNFQVTDNISVTPALIYLSRPAGQNTPKGETFNAFGGLVQVGFKF
ncbi:iron uptake porin [Synechococcus sp. HK05]|uniref:iron uptake porin n=1 Tax=Synechococcus sp. HK05 TaxID=2725975 RepID=UPI001C394F04|nr:iron uptake porin [Synechococcus sp. HK05]MBV2350722.1 iron uptake porin [Synechococcus sp. HK05]